MDFIQETFEGDTPEQCKKRLKKVKHIVKKDKNPFIL